jgi:hypothetical protein
MVMTQMPQEIRLRTPDALSLVHFGDARDEVFARLYAQREQALERSGWTVVTAAVEWSGRDRVSVAYTVGLLECANHPELVLAGLETEPDLDEDGHLRPGLSVMILRELGERVAQRRETLVAGKRTQLLEHEPQHDPQAEAEPDVEPAAILPIALGAVDPGNLARWLPQAYLRSLPECLRALQVILPDDDGRFPWEPHCDPSWVAEQPLLAAPDTPAAGMVASSVDGAPPPLDALARQVAGQMLATRAAAEDALRASQERIVANSGWLVQGVLGDPQATPPLPTWAYTIGLLMGFGRPEIIAVGLPTNVAAALLNDLGERISHGGAQFSDGQVVDDVANFPVVFRRVHPSRFAFWLGRGLQYTLEHDHSSYAALQMVWPDPQGFFPWEPGFDEQFRVMQPPLYEPAQPDGPESA